MSVCIHIYKISHNRAIRPCHPSHPIVCRYLYCVNYINVYVCMYMNLCMYVCMYLCIYLCMSTVARDGRPLSSNPYLSKRPGVARVASG